MTRPDEVLNSLDKVVVVEEGVVGCSMRRDLLAAQKVRWKLHKRPWMRNPIDGAMKPWTYLCSVAMSTMSEGSPLVGLSDKCFPYSLLAKHHAC